MIIKLTKMELLTPQILDEYEHVVIRELPDKLPGITNLFKFLWSKKYVGKSNTTESGEVYAYCKRV